MGKRQLPSVDVEQYDDGHESVAEDHSDGADDTALHNETNLNDGVELIAPNTMHELVKEFIAYAEKEGVAEKARVMAPMVEKFLEATGKKDAVDATQFLKSFKNYSVLSMKNLDIRTMGMCSLHFLESGPAVKNFPDYPKHLPSLFDYYCKKHGLNGTFGNRKEVALRIETETEERMQCEKELAELTEKHIADLKAFIYEHKGKLNHSQLQFAQEQLKKITKKTTPPTPRPVKKAKTDQPALPQTAFEFYARTQRDMYTDRTAEKREKKLRKEFEKLDEATRAIFDGLAFN